MRAYDIIRKKRDGGALEKQEISFLIEGHLRGDVPDYQMSAFLMAVYLRGMEPDETLALTEAMLATGRRLDLGDITGVKLDKHSTGGVGDKVSIILAPLMASMGVKVPMMSGRGLGHTGGTLDKLESIPGLRTDLTEEELRRNLRDVGFAMMGQSAELAPSDRRLYALRDVTATVESIPLIAASIMSKKLAEGIEGLVLDVKVGSGAFLKDIEQARALARTMVDIGGRMGVMTAAVITDMDEPLGRTIGNSLEIKECLSAFKGVASHDLAKVTMTLAAWMLNMADALGDEVPLQPMTEQVRKKYVEEAADYMEKGDAFKRFVQFIDAQHGDPEVAFKPGLLPAAKNTSQVLSREDGFLQRLDAEAVGTASMLLGAGRTRAEDAIDHSAGIILTKKVGEHVEKDEPLAMLHYNDGAQLKEALDAFYSGVRIGPREPRPRRLIHETVMPA